MNKPDSFSLDCPQTTWTKRISASEWVGYFARTWGVSASDSGLREAVLNLDQPHRREFVEWNGKKLRFRSVREKFGMGFLDLRNQAKLFLASKADSATANRIADLEMKLAAVIKDNEEARATIDQLMAEKGKRPVGRPRKDAQEAA